jgi:hypothetical protein
VVRKEEICEGTGTKLFWHKNLDLIRVGKMCTRTRAHISYSCASYYIYY